MDLDLSVSYFAISVSIYQCELFPGGTLASDEALYNGHTDGQLSISNRLVKSVKTVVMVSTDNTKGMTAISEFINKVVSVLLLGEPKRNNFLHQL